MFGGVGGGGPRTIEVVGPATKELGPLQFLGPAENINPAQGGLRVSPANEQVSEEQRSCPISSDRMQMKKNREASPSHNWKEGGRRDDQGGARSLEIDSSRYARSNYKNSPSSMISVFGRPLLMGDSSGQEGSLKLKKIVELEPLRMVTTDGREWGSESSDALEVFKEAPNGEGQQGEESASVESKDLGYEKWEDSCLIKFSEFLGFSTVGFESEILGLLSKIVAR